MAKLWKTSDDGSINYQLITAKYIEPALELLKHSFCCYETACRSIGLNKNPEAIAEFAELGRNAIKDGVTVLAIDKTKDKVIGAAFNKLQVNQNYEEDSYFEKFVKNCKFPESRAAAQFMIDADNLCNLFEHCNVNVLLELMFLTTDPAYRGLGIGKTLCEVTVQVAKELYNGSNVKQPIDDSKLTLEPIPKIVGTIFTSFISQKIGRALNFDIAAKESYEKFVYQGRAFSDVIGSETPFLTLEYKQLL